MKRFIKKFFGEKSSNNENQDALNRLEVVAEQQHIALLSCILEDNAIGPSYDRISMGVKLAESVDPTIGVAQCAA